ncbi:MAG: insulinase family protein [Verrucomicrobiae bacterium]|nr:insulinase family protein [Verrucomicrobiae bacterium]
MTSQTHTTRLGNGVRVATVEMPHMQSAAVGFWTGTGSRHERDEENGVAHFIEHLLFKGTARRSAETISREIERLGATLDAFTSEEQTCYHARGPAEKLEPMLETIADFFQHPRFDPGDIDNERGVIREEIAMGRDLPAQQLEDLTSAAAWPDHPLGRPITGTPESLRRLDESVVRRFHRAAYQGSQTVVSVAGRVTHDAVVRLIEREFAAFPAGAPMVAEPAPSPRPGFAFEAREDVEQVHLDIGFHGCHRHDPERYAEKLLNVLLGENMSSRLFQELREREGICYEVQSDTMTFDDAGFLHLYVALAPENLPATLASVGRILGDFRERPPAGAELEEAKAYLIGQSRVALENTVSEMMWAGETLLAHDEVLDPEIVHARIEAVTPPAVRAIAGRLFRPDNLVVSAVGSKKCRPVLEDWRAVF